MPSASEPRILAPPKAYLQTPGPIPIAHRGGALLWPENTVFAFEQAYGLGIRWIETDVHLSADGQVMVFHDDSLERTTDGTGLIRDKTLEELRRLDAAWHFEAPGRLSYRGQGIGIPTLAEALAVGPDLHLNLEIKQKTPPMREALLAEIRRLGVQDRVLVASAMDAEVSAFRSLCGGRLATSAGKLEIAAFWARAHGWGARGFRPAYDALQVPHYYRGIPVVTRRFVAAAHRCGLKVHVWTIDDVAEMQALVDMGVDAVMSDRPDLLVQILPPF